MSSRYKTTTSSSLFAASSSNSMSSPSSSFCLNQLFSSFLSKRDQFVLIFTIILLLLFNLLLPTTWLLSIQFWSLQIILLSIAYQHLAPFLYDSLPFIEKPLVNPTGKAVLITGSLIAFISFFIIIILLIGCDSGFGHLLARRLVAKGYYVFAGCLNGNSPGAELLRSNYRTDDQLLVVPLDVTSDEIVANARKIVEEKLLLASPISTAIVSNKKQKANQNNNNNKSTRLGLWAVVNNAGIMSLMEIEFGDMTPFMKQVLDTLII